MRDADDPKGLIREAYAIEGIRDPECRSIFLDWYLSMAEGEDPRPAIERLLAKYGQGRDDHPMTLTLKEGLAAPPEPKRRGGRAGRLG
ncbi:hypothetical protein [Pelagovum pacificum]|uniref:Uncharacterized protein n=1 Tax=Pelagovum pacificum TaxID=2588711 RepID=A0A5C5GCK7_9RHOB|nr:hypothetical protein [Pelagovum pacificum]QQA44419.1 hypothetical protein I8N54_07570 [Pelagovum pacificum]TNY32463.1 hypothetical protein FHY64_04005 [Pelagovum pacificum]